MRRAFTIFAVLVAAFVPHCSWAHDVGAITPQFIRSANAISAAFSSRDAILTNPSATEADKSAAESFVYLSFVWSKPSLTVCFWQNKPDDTDLINAILNTMSIWGQLSQVTFEGKDQNGIRHCTDHNSADIRVTLDPLDTSYYTAGDPIMWDWSRYGHLAKDVSALVSMSLINARYYYVNGMMLDFHFLVAHETGHALGLIHEHQRVDCVSWLAGDDALLKVWPYWHASDIAIFKANLGLIPESRSTESFGSFDVNSIMMYNFDQRIWRVSRPGEVNPCARPKEVEYPDAQDQNGIVKLYGKRPVAVAANVATAPPSPPHAAPASLSETKFYYAALRTDIDKLIKLRGTGSLVASYDDLRMDAVGASHKAGALARALTEQSALSPDSKLRIGGVVVSGPAIDRLAQRKADLQAKFDDMIKNMDEAITAASQ